MNATNVTAIHTEKPDQVIDWIEDLEGEIETFAVARPTVDSTLKMEGGKA